MPKRILIAEDEASVRNAVRNFIESRTPFEVCEAADGDEALHKAAALKPENPACPEHATYMVPYKFEIWEINRPVENGFRCADLTCGIIYIEGDDGGFYTLETNGEVTPYP